MGSTLYVQAASSESFARFGTFIGVPGKLPSGREEFFSYRDKVGVMDIEGQVSVGVLQVTERQLRFHQMERHVQTPEMLIAVKGDVLLPVAAANHPVPSPEQDRMAVFRLKEGEAVIMNTGVWHWIPFSVQGEVTLLVVFKAGTPEGDLAICDLGEEGEVIVSL